MAISLGDAILYLKADPSQLNSALGAARADVQRSVGNILDAARGMGVAFTAVGGAITGALGLAAREAIAFESAFAGVRKTVAASEPELAEMRTQFLELSKIIPVSAVELAKIGETAGQLGVRTANVVDFTRTIADLSVATNLTGEAGASMLAQFAVITQIDQSKFSNLGSAIVDLGNNSSATEQGILEMGLRLAGAGTMAGMTAPQILGLSSALAGVGINAEAGGTAFSRVISIMKSAVLGGGKDLEGFAKIAKASGDALVDTADKFATLFKSDPAIALTRFIQGLSNLSKQGKDTDGMLNVIGLSAMHTKDALNRSALAVDEFEGSLIRAEKAFADNIALNKEATERYKTTESQLILLKNTVTAMSIEVGGAMLPALKGFVDVAKPIVEAVTKWAQEHPKLTEAIVLSSAAFGALALTLGTTLFAIGQMGGGILTLTQLFGAGGVGSGLLGSAKAAATALGEGAGGLLNILGLTNPYALAAAAGVTAFLIVYQKIADEKRVNEQLEKTFYEMRRISDLGKTFGVDQNILGGLWEEAGKASLKIGETKTQVELYGEAVGKLSPGIKAITGDIKIYGTAQDQSLKRQKELAELTAEQIEALEKAERAYKALASTFGVTLTPSIRTLTAEGAKLIAQMKAHGVSAQEIAVAQLNIADKIEKAKIAVMGSNEAFLKWRESSDVVLAGLNMLHKGIDVLQSKSIALFDLLNHPPPLLLNEQNLFGPERQIVDAVLQAKMKSLADINAAILQPLSIPAPDKQKFEETFHSMGEIAKRQVSTIVTDFSKGFADILFSGDDWGNKFIDLFKKIGEGIVRAWVESGVVALLSGKGLSGFTDFFGGIMDALQGKKSAGGASSGGLGDLLGLGITGAGAGLGGALLGDLFGGGSAGSLAGAAAGGLGTFLGGSFLGSAIGTGGGLSSGLAGLTGALGAIPVWGWAALAGVLAAGPIIGHFTRRGQEKETATAAVEELGAKVWGPGGIIEAAKEGKITADQATKAVDDLWNQYVTFLGENLEDQTVITRSIESQKHIVDEARTAIEGLEKGVDTAAVQKQVQDFMAELTKTGVMSAAFAQLITDAGMSVDQFMVQADIARLQELQGGFAGLREELIALQPVQEDAFQKFLQTGQVTDELRAKIQEYGDTFANAREGTLRAAQALGAFNEYAKATNELQAFQGGGLAAILEGLNQMAPAGNDPMEFFLKFHEITPELEAQINSFGLSLQQFSDFADLAGMTERFHALADSFGGTAQEIANLQPMFEMFGGNLEVLNAASALPGLIEQKNQIGEWITEIERFLPHVEKLKTNQKEMMETFFKTGQVSKEMMDWVTGAGGQVTPFQDFGAAKSLLDTFTRLRAEFTATKNETLGIADFVHQFGGAAANAALASGAKLSDVLNLVEAHLKENMTTQAGLIQTELGNMKTGVELAIFNLQNAMSLELAKVAVAMDAALETSRIALVGSIATLQTSLEGAVTTTRGALIGMLTTMDLSLNASIQNFQNSVVMAVNNLTRALSGLQTSAPPPPTTTTPPPTTTAPPPPTGLTTGLRDQYTGRMLTSTSDLALASTVAYYSSPYEEPTYGTVSDADSTSTSSLSTADGTSGSITIEQTNIFNRDTSLTEERRMLERVNDTLVTQLSAYA